MIRTAGAPRARTFGFALLAALPLLAGCASVIPMEGGSRPAIVTPAPARPLGTPRPYVPRPSERPGAVAQPIPATPLAPLPAAVPPAEATTAAASGVIAGPDFATLGVTAEQAAAALAAFRISCPSVQRRADTSGLTQGADWAESCTAAKNWADKDALAFYTR
jgi:membrane-bound lytic murein transglycosylase A